MCGNHHPITGVAFKRNIMENLGCMYGARNKPVSPKTAHVANINCNSYSSQFRLGLFFYWQYVGVSKMYPNMGLNCA
jgi:hypothetical protein